MRIRRRPQAQALIPSPLHHQPSDPSTAPSQAPNAVANQLHWLPRKEGEVEEKRKLHPSVDLGGGKPSPAARRPGAESPSQPQGGNNVVGRSENAPGRGGGGGARRQGAATADGHGSVQNGHRDEYEWLVINAGEERLVNGVMPAMPPVTSPTAVVHAKEGIKSDGPKRRRGPAVLLEGSRCSRVNGRGWRCSQPTLVGYALCEHHLGKGRQSRSANNGGGGGRGGRSAGGPKLGRTEPASSRKSASPLALTLVAAEPDATEPAAHLAAEFS